MAVAPLFIADMPTLKKTLRLSGVPAGVDAEALIEEAVLNARAAFYRRLTQTRIDTVKTTSYTETPTTDAEYLRVLANLTETKLVRLELMRTLPIAFMDGGGSIDQQWNDEAPFRNASQGDLERERKRLERDISENMELLAQEESAGSETSIQVTTFEADTPPPRPGESLWGPFSSGNTGNVD